MPLEEPPGLTPGPAARAEGDEASAAALRGRRCWVVGCGFLGSCLVQQARMLGMQALGVDLRAAPGVDACGDAAQAAVLAQARARLEPELIFCCAATHGGDEAAYRATYLELPRALHAACPGARVVFCSSTSLYAGQGGEWVVECPHAACRAATARAQLLLEAEAAVLAMAPAGGHVVARLVPLYGEGRCELLRRHLQREPELPGEDGRWLNYLHREDAARALLCLAAHLLGGAGGRLCPPVVNVCGESFCKGEVYAALAELTGLPRVEKVAAAGRRGVSNQRVSARMLRGLGWAPQVAFLPWAARQLGG